MKYKKALLTVGAIGVLGTAGSFGTFAAFTDALPADESTIDTGNIEITGDFAIPDISNLVTGDPAQAGSVTITNTGDRNEEVWVDQDGPVGNLTDLTGAAGGFSDHLLAENLIVNSTMTLKTAADVVLGTTPLDQGTRLWKVNRRGLSPLPGAGSTPTSIVPLSLAPGQKVTLDYTVNLRERGATGADDAGVGVDTSALDNLMQNQTITQTVHVRSIEAGGNDFGPANGIPFDDGLGTPAGSTSS